MTVAKWFEIIRKESAGLSLHLKQTQIENLIFYLELLYKWNNVHNLTAIRNKEDMVYRHILDSLCIVSYVSGGVLDVGSGPGLPGIPLAIACPEIYVTTLDSNGKKVRFMEHVRLQLGIKNLQVIQERVEEFKVYEKFDVIVSRAFSSLRKMFINTRHLLDENGFFLAMKGRYPSKELLELETMSQVNLINVVSNGFRLGQIERHLVIMNMKKDEKI